MKLLEYSSEYKDKVYEFVYKAMLENPEKTPEGLKEELVDLEDIETAYLANGGKFYLLESKAGDIVGTVALKVMPGRQGKLKRFYVKDIYRRSGLGKLLYDSIEEYSRSINLSVISLAVGKNLVEAQNFYKKQGFNEVYGFCSLDGVEDTAVLNLCKWIVQ